MEESAHAGDVADPTELAGLAEQVGLDGGRVANFLTSDEGAADVRAQIAAARRRGITVVPTFVFESGELLSGRAKPTRFSRHYVGPASQATPYPRTRLADSGSGVRRSSRQDVRHRHR